MYFTRATWIGLIVLCVAQAPLMWLALHLLGRPPSWHTDFTAVMPNQPTSDAADRLIATAVQVQKAITELSLATGVLGERLANVEGEVGKIAVARRIRVVQAKCEQATQHVKETKAEMREVKQDVLKTQEDVQETKEAVQNIADEVPLWKFWNHLW